MYSTLVIIMTFQGAGYQPPITQAIALPAPECAYYAAHAPQRTNWKTTAFCTPGGDPKLNPGVTGRKFP